MRSNPPRIRPERSPALAGAAGNAAGECPLLAAWRATVQRAPDAVALIAADTARRLSRADLDTAAESWRATHGNDLRGQRVVIAEPNGAAWLSVFLGVLKAGAVAVPLDPGEPPAAQRRIAEALRAPCLWSSGQLHRLAANRPAARGGACLLKLTSGSTGAPRAVAFTAAQMLADGRQVCGAMDIRATDVNLGLIPFGHSYGLGNLVLPLLSLGSAIVAGVPALPQAMAECVARWRPTVFPAVPALLRAWVDADVAPAQLASLRTVISAGAPLAAEIAEAFFAKFGRKIHSFYGSTETGGIAYDTTGDAARTGRSVGRPMPGVTVEFGAGGRLTVESAAVFTLGNRARGAAGLGCWRPADVARRDAAGELVLLGRAGRVVKIAGRRLELAEVERALKNVPGVADAWVAPHPSRSEALAAVVATARHAAELRAVLRAEMAAWKIPKHIVTLPALPLTSRGKTDAVKLRALLRE